MQHPTQLLNDHTEGGIVQQIGQQLQDVSRFAPLLQRLLPPELRSHCRLVCVHRGRWLLCADSPEWVFRLRFAAAGIHRTLRDRTLRDRALGEQPAGFRAPTRIDVLTEPHSPMPERQSRLAAPQLPPRAAKLLRQAIEDLTQQQNTAPRSRPASDTASR